MAKRIGILLAVLTVYGWGQIFSDPNDQAIYELGKEAYRGKKWQEAYNKYTQILIQYPSLIDLRYERALCLKSLNKVDEAIAEFEEIVNIHNSHILSNYQLALLRMQKPKNERTEEDEADAKQRLKEAAQYGFDVIGAIENDAALKVFESDVSYILELIAAPTQREKINIVLIDPFKDLLVPARDIVDPASVETVPEETTAVAPPAGLDKQRQLLEAIILLLIEIEDSLHWDDEDKADALFTEVEELVKHVREINYEELIDLRNQALDKYDSISKNIQVVRLKRFERVASGIIDEMKQHIELSQFVQVETDYQKLQRHLTSVQKEDVMFVESAKVWTNKGLKWLRISRKLRDAASLEIHLSGVVYGKDRDQEVRQAIVNDEILAQGDGVRDITGAPITNLKVKDIGRNYVKFYYDGVEFDWYMGLDKPIGFVYVEEE